MRFRALQLTLAGGFALARLVYDQSNLAMARSRKQEFERGLGAGLASQYPRTLAWESVYAINPVVH